MGTLAEAIAPSTRSTGPAAAARGRRAGVGLDDRPVLGDEAQDAGPQGGHGQAELQARPARRGPGRRAACRRRCRERSASARGSRLRTAAAARAQLPAHPGQPEAGAGDEAQDVALAAAPGPARPGAAPGGRTVAGGTTSLPASTVAGVRGNGGRVPSVISWWISRPERGAVERGQPRLLAEDVLGLGPGQHVALDLVDPLRELRRACGPGPARWRRWRRRRSR